MYKYGESERDNKSPWSTLTPERRREGEELARDIQKLGRDVENGETE